MKSVQTAERVPPVSQEAHLVHRAQSGDSEAFAQLYNAYVERIYRYIYFRVPEDFSTEELVSQVFLKAWQNISRYRTGTSPFVAWLYTIARNLVYDYYRAKKDLVPLEEVESLPSEAAAPDDEAQLRFDLQAMRDALQFLSQDQQQVLILKYIADLPNETIARIMNKQQGTIRGLQMRALQILSKYLREKQLI